MVNKRNRERVTRRLEVEFSVSGETMRGISSNVSEKGIFIRTKRGFVVGTPLDITIHLPDGKLARAKGVVRRTIKTLSSVVKNGMGIELLECDEEYVKFIRSHKDNI